MNKYKYETPSTLIRMLMGQFDYELYMATKDDKFDTSNGIMTITSEI